MPDQSPNGVGGTRPAKSFSPQDVPRLPGVYVFRNAAGEVIYVGKAKSLRQRMSSYFQPSRSRRADPKLRALINSIDTYEALVVQSEAEALLLESRLIKEYHPRYNVNLRDDKRFLHICIDPEEAFPRLVLVRIRRDDGRLYFGPFPHAGVLRQTVQFLSRHFKLRTCTARIPDAQTFKHCLEHAIRNCCCPCCGKETPDGYQARVEAVIDVLQGNVKELTAELEARMAAEAQSLKFEDAARTRDIIANLKSVCDPRRRVFTRAGLDTEGHRAGEQGVAALMETLGLADAPDWIECFDMSAIGGSLAVGSMVCFRAGRPSKKAYRRYRIRSPEATDDTAMMAEVLGRRYAPKRTDQGRRLPDLILVDGGQGQLNAAIATLERLGVPPTPILGLAKKEEGIVLPGRAEPLILPREHLGLRLLQSVRDEAHRFANTYHRELRRKRIADSVLLDVPGIGAKRRAELLKKMGSVRRLRAAAAEDIADSVPGIGLETARRLKAFLDASAPMD